MDAIIVEKLNALDNAWESRVRLEGTAIIVSVTASVQIRPTSSDRAKVTREGVGFLPNSTDGKAKKEAFREAAAQFVTLDHGE